MNPVLLHLYGPVSIHIYGVCILIGSIISFYFLSNDKKITSVLSINDLSNIFQILVISGFFGGRIGYMLSSENFSEDFLFLFKFWEPGLAILGAIIGAIIAIGAYLYYKKCSALLFLDRISIYAPLAQSFGRLGCFLTGCCYGKPSNSWHAVTYTHHNHMAPLDIKLQPSQLYSSIILLCIFFLLYFIIQHRFKKPGLLFFSYIALISIERFCVDFTRFDQDFLAKSGYINIFSAHQWIALIMFISACIGGLFVSHIKDKKYGSI